MTGAAPGPGQGTRAFAGPVILVIDDDAGIRQMMALALGEAGYDVRLADGQSDVVVDGVDLVVVDLRLGRRSATELFAAQPELTARPHVVVTATAHAAEAARAFPSASAVIQKPFDLDVLQAAIERALAQEVRPA